MCGICGSFAYRASAGRDPAVGRRMLEVMSPRGPDGSGEWRSPDGRVWLGHRRLAIIDLSPTGAQPMASEDGSLVVSFNGEIYNYRSIRAGLEAAGVRFRSTSDTEVLLHLYRSKGPGFVRELRGMFAFVLWDANARRLLAARDPYGIKPLYFADTGGVFSFASCVKALVLDPAISRAPDSAGVTGFFVLGSVPEPWTIYRDVRCLPAGCTLVVDASGPADQTRFHSIPATIRASEAAIAAPWDADADCEVAEALRDSVRHHMIADVPVGAFLSAGVDSGALVGLMRDVTAGEIRTLTLSYDEFAGRHTDEAPLAAQTAARYATSHVCRRVGREEFLRDLPRIMAAMDQPSIDGINTWFVSKVTREAGIKVAISGVGGDELLGGYDTFQKLPRLVRWGRGLPRLVALDKALAVGMRAVARFGVELHPKWPSVAHYSGDLASAWLLQRSVYLPAELDDVIADADFVREGLRQLRISEHVAHPLVDGPVTNFGRVAALETCHYLRNQLLRDTDWASMAHSLEVRTPLVDAVLLDRIMPQLMRPGRPGCKALLANAPSKPLPVAISSRRKTGFGIPVQTWVAESELGRDLAAERSVAFSRNWLQIVAKLQSVDSGGSPAASRGSSVAAAP